MSRAKVRLAINSEKLRQLVKDKETFSELAQRYGVTKQAVSQWLSDGEMPPRAIVELVRDLDVSQEDLEELLAPQLEKSNKKKWVITIEEK